MASSRSRPRRLTQAHYAAIGRVAESWAALELGIDIACWSLAGVSPALGACMTAQVIGPSRKLDALKSLILVRGGGASLVDELNKFIATSHALAEKRNRAVHDPWMAGDDGVPERYQATAKGKLVLGAFPVPTTELQDLHRNIEGFLKAFEEIRQSALALLLLKQQTQ